MLQVFVYGDSLKAQLVAVVVPDPEVMLPWARERNLPQVCRQMWASMGAPLSRQPCVCVSECGLGATPVSDSVSVRPGRQASES